MSASLHGQSAKDPYAFTQIHVICSTPHSPVQQILLFGLSRGAFCRLLLAKFHNPPTVDISALSLLKFQHPPFCRSLSTCRTAVPAFRRQYQIKCSSKGWREERERKQQWLPNQRQCEVSDNNYLVFFPHAQTKFLSSLSHPLSLSLQLVNERAAFPRFWLFCTSCLGCVGTFFKA